MTCRRPARWALVAGALVAWGLSASACRPGPSGEGVDRSAGLDVAAGGGPEDADRADRDTSQAADEGPSDGGGAPGDAPGLDGGAPGDVGGPDPGPLEDGSGASDAADGPDGDGQGLAPACVDADEDGYGQGCPLGPDCDDTDATRWSDLLAWTDEDGDGVGVPPEIVACAGASARGGLVLPLGVAPAEGAPDCDDTDGAVWLGAQGYADGDADGVGEGEALAFCVASLPLPAGFVEAGGDCAPGDGEAWAEVPTYADVDADGVGAGPGTVGCHGATAPAGTSFTPGDCDDMDAALTTLVALLRDRDGDGHPADGAQAACVAVAPPGWVLASDALEPEDCHDRDPRHHADCGACLDVDGDGRGPGCDLGGDCDDAAPLVHDGAVELPGDGVAQACGSADGLVAGVYVSPVGRSAAGGGLGTPEAPFADPVEALAMANALGLDGPIVMAVGVYTVTQEVQADRGIVGGFDPITWTRPGDGGPPSYFVRGGLDAPWTVRVPAGASGVVLDALVIPGLRVDSGADAALSRAVVASVQAGAQSGAVDVAGRLTMVEVGVDGGGSGATTCTTVRVREGAALDAVASDIDAGSCLGASSAVALSAEGALRWHGGTIEAASTQGVAVAVVADAGASAVTLLRADVKGGFGGGGSSGLRVLGFETSLVGSRVAAGAGPGANAVDVNVGGLLAAGSTLLGPDGVTGGAAVRSRLGETRLVGCLVRWGDPATVGNAVAFFVDDSLGEALFPGLVLDHVVVGGETGGTPLFATGLGVIVDAASLSGCAASFACQSAEGVLLGDPGLGEDRVHLLPTSPSIGAGVDLFDAWPSRLVDWDGTPRPQGEWDAGADEVP